MTRRNTTTARGFSMVEMLVYLAALVLLALLVVETVLGIGISHRRVVVAQTIATSAGDALERMTREIKKATDIDLVQSMLDTNPGRLRLLTTNDSGFLQTITFTLENGVINLYENDLLSGPLTSSRASTTRLVFHTYNGSSKVVGVELTVEATSTTGLVRDESFQTTAVLRNSL